MLVHRLHLKAETVGHRCTDEEHNLILKKQNWQNTPGLPTLVKDSPGCLEAHFQVYYIMFSYCSIIKDSWERLALHWSERLVTRQAPKFSGKILSRFSYIVDPGVGATRKEEDLVSQGGGSHG